MITIKQSQTALPILNALVAAGGTAKGGDVLRTVLTTLGGDPGVKGHYNSVNSAKFDLKQRGLLEDAGHGTWRITDAGRDVAAGAPMPSAPRKTAPGAGAPATEVASAPADEAPTMARAEEPAAEAPVAEVAEAAPVVGTAPAPVKRRLKVANAPAVDVPEWLADEGIRALAIEATECFGAWSAKSAECGKCPLAGWCRNAKASTLALLAAKLTTETPAAPEAVKPSVAKLDAAVGAANAPEAPRAAVPEALAGVRLKATHDGVCAVSGRPVVKGDAVRYVAGVGVIHLDVEVPAK